MFKRMFTENEINEIAKEASGDVVEVSNITAIPTKVLNALKAGDTVVKLTGNMKHSYRVSYKEDKHGICLTYTDASISETVSYDYNTGTKKWVYNSTDITELNSGGSGDSTVLVEIEMQGGTIASNVLEALVAKPYNVVFSATNMYLRPITIALSGVSNIIFTLVGGSGQSLSGMSVQVDKTTGTYTIS